MKSQEARSVDENKLNFILMWELGAITSLMQEYQKIKLNEEYYLHFDLVLIIYVLCLIYDLISVFREIVMSYD
jgi:hypothetical protein